MYISSFRTPHRGLFLVHCGVIAGLFWLHFGLSRGQFGLIFGSLCGSFWGHSRQNFIKKLSKPQLAHERKCSTQNRIGVAPGLAFAAKGVEATLGEQNLMVKTEVRLKGNGIPL